MWEEKNKRRIGGAKKPLTLYDVSGTCQNVGVLYHDGPNMR